MTHRLSSPSALPCDHLTQSHCSCTLLAHVVWSTDRRIAVLDRRIEPWLRDMLTPGSSRGHGRVGIGVADDHLHSLLRFPSTVTLAAVVQRLKGASSYECNQRGLLPTRLRWQRGYWAQSVGPDAVVPLLHYLATQREHHACHPMSVLFNARGLAGSAVLLFLTVLRFARTVRVDEADAVCCEPAAGGLGAP